MYALAGPGVITRWRMLPAAAQYIWAAGLIVTLYGGLVALLLLTKDFDASGPLSFRAPPLTAAISGGAIDDLDELQLACFGAARVDGSKYVGAVIDGRPYHACYRLLLNGQVIGVEVVDDEGYYVDDVPFLKRTGAWPWRGSVTDGGDFALRGAAIGALLVLGLFYRRRSQWERPVGTRWLFGTAWVLALIFAFGELSKSWGFAPGDSWEMTTSAFVFGTLLFAYFGGAWLLGSRARPRQPTWSTTTAITAGAPALPFPPREAPLVRVQTAGELPTYADVGGMEDLKAELRDTLGLMLAFTGDAERFGIRWNGILLHGKPGTGKSFLTAATAGEFGLNLVAVPVGELLSSYRNRSAQNVERAFREALAHLPCILFFDEFDAIAQRRDAYPDTEARNTVNALLQAIERYRAVNDLIVFAATNDRDGLDPAVIRPGRFDRLVHVGLPDAAARGAVFAARLRGRPVADDIDLVELARLAEGLTPAAIAQAVELASIKALRAATSDQPGATITMELLTAALAERAGTERPLVGEWTWDRLVLPERTKRELQEIAALFADPSRAHAYGVRRPTGLLLTGAPGTGKTTIARVLAAQSGCSFYAATHADITSKWFGESQDNIARLFERARQHRPAIVFLDEIDALAPARGVTASAAVDAIVAQLLQEIDGLDRTSGVFVLAATNRPDLVDPALLRGGRLARHVEIPLPDTEQRVRLLELFTANMPLRNVNLRRIAAETEGLSGADLETLCQDAALAALLRSEDIGARTPVLDADFADALGRRATLVTT